MTWMEKMNTDLTPGPSPEERGAHRIVTLRAAGRTSLKLRAAGIEAESPKCESMCAAGLAADSPMTRLAAAAQENTKYYTNYYILTTTY